MPHIIDWSSIRIVDKNGNHFDLIKRLENIETSISDIQLAQSSSAGASSGASSGAYSGASSGALVPESELE